MLSKDKCVKCNDKCVYKTNSFLFCRGHFNEYIFGKVKRILKSYSLPNTKKILALSGGKDSTLLFYILSKLGYDFSPIYIDFGFCPKTTNFISKLSLYFKKEIIIITDRDYNIKVKDIIEKSKTNPCVLCSSIRRYILNDYAYKNGFDVIITGHNLTDIINQTLNNIKNSFLLGFKNTTPYLRSNKKLIARLKPLYLVTDNEAKTFVKINKIPFLRLKCKYFKGFFFKKYINLMEKENIDVLIKMAFSLINLSKIVEEIKSVKLFADKECSICGYPSTSDICYFCKIKKYC